MVPRMGFNLFKALEGFGLPSTYGGMIIEIVKKMFMK